MTSEPRWLSPAELEGWMSLTYLMSMLPTVLTDQLQRESDLSFTEYYVLAGLSDAPERTMRMSRLALFANAELSRLSHMVKRLENRGLVRREPDPTDGRYTNAILTDDGFAHLQKAAPAHVARVRELVFDALSPEEVSSLHAIAEKINRRINPEDCAAQ
ncbi:MarR family winged helix-turn-helix transcriptional regulator [Nocardioides sp. Kera G14]|uniref:MarR family winged helix-turn-helix transcriptional regulator n=1 Tax=Nocardioides sp. Kera G14 TaxID=2884264 RepID=UPI001D12B8E8|nr:MarR family transcriptional regulator [Nocardioides sp. Kera G14]UDY23382.1 MarR family transcriptional regulator [Nocardioides sp. Kera G14]